MKKIIKFLYSKIPLKKEVFIILKRYINIKKSITQHLHFKGYFSVKVDNYSTFKMYHPGTIEENEIFWYGLNNGWEKKSVSLWYELVKNADVIFDIGSNTGLYSLIAKSVNINSQIFAFEPLPGVYKILDKNIKKNNFSINSFCLGISNYNGEAKVFLPQGTDFAYSVTVNKKTISQENAQVLKIEVTKLSTFIEKYDIRNIDLMKIDVETHEIEVLLGMEEYLNKFKPTLLIEVLNEEIGHKLSTMFDNMGYLYFNIDDENNTVRREEKITKSDYWNYLICNEKIAHKLNLI